jgi:hypothetical protein
VTVHISTGQDGNVFQVMGRVTSAMRDAGHADSVPAFQTDLFNAASYSEALSVCSLWVNIT